MKGLTFSEPMVKAWLAGRKTVTRRLMNPQPGFWVGVVPYRGNIGDSNHDIEIKPPYHPGETVYIKEIWGIASRMGYLVDPCLNYKADGKQVCIEPKVLIDNNYKRRDGWRSPRFMPEWAARSHALVVSVRPERVQEINEDEAHLEGFETKWTCLNPKTGSSAVEKYAADSFRDIWESLHPGSWARNDWVWRIELKKKEGK